MTKQMIVLEEESSWPQEIHDLIMPHIEQISIERELDHIQRLEGKSWLSTLGRSKYVEAVEQLAALLRQYIIKGYHCTRVLDTETILREGLLPLKAEQMTTRITEALATCLKPEEVPEAEAMLHEYVNSPDFENRQQLLWFYLTPKQAEAYHCQELLEYFGGEATRNALHSKRYKYYPVLKKIGTPVVFECLVHITDGTDEQVQDLAEKLLAHLIDKETEDVTLTIKTELSIRKPVGGADILSVKESQLYASHTSLQR